MTPEEMRAGVERLAPWFHRIELAPSVYTKDASIAGEPVDHPYPTWELVRQALPDDLTGKSVLDVGCNGGYYAVEAKRRGAARVLGVDSQRREVSQARFVRRALGLDIEFERMSVYDIRPATVGQFDYVLALGLIYHLKHLVLALENLFAVTKNTLIIETAILPPDIAPPTLYIPFGGVDRNLHPLVYVENPADASEPAFNWFIPTTACAKAMLENVGFEEVTVVAEVGARAVLACHKPEVASAALVGRMEAHLTLEDGPQSARPGADLSYTICVENRGVTRWRSQGENGGERGMIRLGAHVADEDEEVVWDWGRASLPNDLGPGEQATLAIHLTAPTEPGAYSVEFDMVAEGLAWFEDFGSPILRDQLYVRDGA
ncbi:MAG: DUF1698 domain-containing protein [Anaerolineae bacterium]